MGMVIYPEIRGLGHGSPKRLPIGSTGARDAF
jgi:hypothetical protein